MALSVYVVVAPLGASICVEETDSKTFFNSSISLMVLRSIISKGSSHLSQSATLKAPAPTAADAATTAGVDEEDAVVEALPAATTVAVFGEEEADENVDNIVDGGRAGRTPSIVFG